MQTLDKPYSFSKWREGNDVRRLRGKQSKVAAVPADSPLRKEAAKLVMRELTDSAVAFLLELGEQEQAEQNRQDAQEKRRSAEVDAVHSLWKGANVSKADGLLHFVHEVAQLGGVVEVNADYRMCRGGDPATMPARLKSGAHAGITVNPDFVLIAVRAADADAFAKRYKLTPTLSWECNGWRVWAYKQSNRAVMGCMGEKVRVASQFGCKDGPVFAPISHKAKWLVGPAKALPKGESELPQPPDALADMLTVASGATGAVVDRVLLG